MQAIKTAGARQPAAPALTPRDLAQLQMLADYERALAAINARCDADDDRSPLNPRNP